MRYAVNAGSMIGFNRNHKSVVADSDQFILDGFSRFAHHAFKRARNAGAQDDDLVTDARQLGTGAIIQLARRQNLICDTRAQPAQIDWQASNQIPKHRATCRARQESTPAPPLPVQIEV